MSAEGIGDKYSPTPTYANVVFCGESYVSSDFDLFTDEYFSFVFLFVNASRVAIKTMARNFADCTH